MRIRTLVASSSEAEAGFTLVELLVAMILSTMVGLILMTALLGGQSSVTASTAQNDLNAEGRTALNRISRDLRQATPVTLNGVTTPAILSVQNPDGVGFQMKAFTSLTLNGDFNADGCVPNYPSDSCPSPPPADPNNPETETFCWDGVSQIYLVPGPVTPGTCNSTTAGSPPQPLLTGRVTAFKFSYRSNLYLYDANGDGITTWSELDAAGPPVGNRDGALDGPELAHVNSVVIDLTLSDAGHTQTYETQVDLRNAQ